MRRESKPRVAVWRRVLWAGLGLLVGALPAAAREGEAPAGGWSSDIVETFAYLPVQDHGRVKPMDSVAGLKLLTLNGKRTLKVSEDEKIGRIPWLLICLFESERAVTLPSFRVQNDAVLTDIGLQAKSKRDWYSYEELVPGRRELMTKAQQIAGIDAAEQTSPQRQTLKLAGDLRQFESLLASFEGLRRDYSPRGSASLAAIVAEGSATPLTDLLRGVDRLVEMSMRLESGSAEEDEVAFQALLGEVSAGIDASMGGLALLPPATGHEDMLEWWSVADLTAFVFDAASRQRSAQYDFEPQLALLAHLERMAAAGDDRATFRRELQGFHDGVVALATARGEYGEISREVSLNRAKPFFWALVLFLLGALFSTGSMVLLAFMGTMKAGKLRYWAGLGSALVSALPIVVAIALVVGGIWARCLIRDRPPVVSLYDTVLVVTGGAVIIFLFLELITRIRVSLFLSAVLGAAGMFLAGRYELKEVASAGDTMASVVAVLDTNYYLAIHVITITLGYAGGLAGCALGHAWLAMKLFGLQRRAPDAMRILSRVLYGIVCVTLLLSLFGTIMGGIWANDSWGRFWGWDPKENGALLICIWEILIIHAYLGGYIRAQGVAIMSVIGGVVVSASWWGVNLLNVGLHSYGFTSGVALTLFGYWAIEAVVVAVALGLALAEILNRPRSGGGDPPLLPSM